MRLRTPQTAAGSIDTLSAAASPAAVALEPAKAPLHALSGVSAALPARELWAGMQLPGFDAAENLARLAASAQRFTPRVSLVPPDGLVLEVKGSLHLFAGIAELRDELMQLTKECLQLQPLLAFAPTPLAALTALVTVTTALLVTVVTSVTLAVLVLSNTLVPVTVMVFVWPAVAALGSVATTMSLKVAPEASAPVEVSGEPVG